MNNAVSRVSATLSHASHILLKGVPTTATSGDLRRAVMLAGVQGITEVSLIYRRFAPTGEALLTMAVPDYAQDALRAANKITFTGSEEISASLTIDSRFSRQRSRGVQGRADALNRGLLGSGPSAGFPSRKTVTVSGVPGRATVHNIRQLVQEFQLADDETNSVLQAPLPENKFSMYTRFVVVLASESEAQRLVRKFHLTPFKNQTTLKYMTAAVIY
ncbi:hypothetical protein BYT27DRAFT_6726275 [Phlegmacium glaucopus]|nr:hypothetical protein BYT27DRAFT_6726275 [Phlegmacium glaucopus]